MIVWLPYVALAVLIVALVCIAIRSMKKKAYRTGYLDGIDDVCAFLDSMDINVNEKEVDRYARH